MSPKCGKKLSWDEVAYCHNCMIESKEKTETLLNDKEKIHALEAENKKLRKMLWLRHGCTGPALYGDDGELHCNKCMIDFKRDLAWKIEKRFCDILLAKLIQEGK